MIKCFKNTLTIYGKMLLLSNLNNQKKCQLKISHLKKCLMAMKLDNLIEEDLIWQALLFSLINCLEVVQALPSPLLSSRWL